MSFPHEGRGLHAAILMGIEGSTGLGGSTVGPQCVIDVYTPMFAALLISAGAVSDRVGAKRCTLPAWRPSWRRRPRGLAPTIGFLIGWRAVQGSAAAVVLSASRQVEGTLAVAVFGALIAQRASFLPGMRASLLIALVVLFAATAASFALPRHRSRKMS